MTVELGDPDHKWRGIIIRELQRLAIPLLVTNQTDSTAPRVASTHPYVHGHSRPRSVLQASVLVAWTPTLHILPEQRGHHLANTQTMAYESDMASQPSTPCSLPYVRHYALLDSLCCSRLQVVQALALRESLRAQMQYGEDALSKVLFQ